MRRRLVLTAAAGLVLSGAAGIAGAAQPATASTGRSPAAVTAGGLEGIPRFAHVVVLTLENSSESTTYGTGSPAVYLNALRAKGVFLPQYYGVGHVSLDNYVAMVSGQNPTPATSSDCSTLSLYSCAQTTTAESGGRFLGDQLDAAHVSWASYEDSTPTNCFHGPYAAGDTTPDPYQGHSRSAPAYDYADRHNPFIYFPDFVGNPARCAAHQHPYTRLAADIRTGRVPAFAFITPDTCHDGHDAPCSDGSPGGLVTADAWLQAQLPPLLRYLANHNGLLIINSDEGSTTDPQVCPSCASGGAGGQVGAVLVSPRLPQGVTVSTGYDHDSLLRTVEDSFGISEHLNLAGVATPMTAAFVGTR